MKKAIVLFSTVWFGLVSFDLPNVNTSYCKAGKNIKAEANSIRLLSPPDSNSYFILPEFRLTDPANYRINTVVIDPGHGGHDPGCMGHNSREKHIVLAIGNFLAEGLRGQFPGLNVIMTRSTDVFVPLHQRASIATENKADLFISIHCNAFPKSYATGTETYVLGLHATTENLEVAKRENEAILLEDNYQENYGYDPNSPEAHILFSMFQNAFLEQSIAFAEKVQDQAHQQTELKNRGVKQAGFLVLRYATMPSVLIETGYLTNSSDEAYLLTDAGQRNMANSILDAFTEYKREMEKTGPETAATVSYLEVKKSPPVKMAPIGKSEQPINNQMIAGGDEPKKTDASSKSAYPQEDKGKQNIVSAIASNDYTPTPTNTNISPKKSAKIAPTIPMNESQISASGTGTNQMAVSKEPVKAPIKEEPIHVTAPVNTTPEKNPVPSGVQFCVQLAASPTLLNVGTGKWIGIGHTVEVIQEAKLYKYQVRNFASLEQANRARSELRSKGFYDAFVVAYKDGQRVDPRILGD